uniref:Protein phosphatase inhibitor 2 n=1 Tax=Anopheles atroparvus TaxID=41427 RepID=A0AAG5D8P1_ANOAO
MSFSADTPDAKKPCKGILKSSSSFDKHSSATSSSVHRKSAKFDELNVLQTYHPPDKDYGHMKVDEPKTPYNYAEEADVDQLDAEILAERLRVAANSQSESVSEEESEEEEEELSEEQKKRKEEFERRRKAHYNEFEAIRLARKLIEEDEDDDDENVETDGAASSAPSSCNSADAPGAGTSTTTAPQSGKDEACMEIEEQDESGSTRKAKATTPEHQGARLKPGMEETV